MQYLDSMLHRLQYLRSPSISLVTQRLWTAGDGTLEKVSRRVPLKGARDPFAVNALYSIVRHRHWLCSSLFYPFFEEHLTNDFQVPRDNIAELNSLISLCVQLTDTPNTEIGEKDFLTYLAISFLVGDYTDNATIDIGFGADAVERVARAFQRNPPQGANQESTQIQFMTHIETQLEESIEALHQRSREAPWYIDQLSLGYRLLEVEDQRLSAKEREEVFRFALSLCMDNEVADFDVESAKRVRFETLLERAGIAFAESGARRKEARPALKLSKIGQRITSRAYAHLATSLGLIDSRLAALDKLPEAYQLALVELAGEAQMQGIRELLQKPRRKLSPRAAIALSAKLNEWGCVDAVEEFGKQLAESSSPWHRAASCEIIDSLGHASRHRDFLGQRASDDTSPLVKDRAIEILLKNQAQDTKVSENRYP